MLLRLQILDSPPTGVFWSAPLASDSDFTARDGSTLAFAEQLIAAHGDGVGAPGAVLDGFLDGRWGEVDLRRTMEHATDFRKDYKERRWIVVTAFDKRQGPL
jgi:hypothetical protein